MVMVTVLDFAQMKYILYCIVAQSHFLSPSAIADTKWQWVGAWISPDRYVFTLSTERRQQKQEHKWLNSPLPKATFVRKFLCIAHAHIVAAQAEHNSSFSPNVELQFLLYLDFVHMMLDCDKIFIHECVHCVVLDVYRKHWGYTNNEKTVLSLYLHQSTHSYDMVICCAIL